MNNNQSQTLVPKTVGTPAGPATELAAAQLRCRVATTINFRTTEELATSHGFVGQKRAWAALDLGVGIADIGEQTLAGPRDWAQSIYYAPRGRWS